MQGTNGLAPTWYQEEGHFANQAKMPAVDSLGKRQASNKHPPGQAAAEPVLRSSWLILPVSHIGSPAGSSGWLSHILSST